MERKGMIQEYFKANIEKKLAVIAPDDEDQTLTPATRLLEKRKEMLQVEAGLQSQKETFSLKMETLARRKEELERKESDLKGSLTKFERFLKENESKRIRALKKAGDEEKIRETKESEISKTRKVLTSLEKKKAKQIASIQYHLKFQRYLENVVEHCEDFGEIKDIIARQDTLNATQMELQNRAKEAQELTENERQTHFEFLKTKNTAILNYDNELAKLQTSLEEAQSKTAKNQTELDRVMNGATQKTLLLGQIKL